MSWDAHCVQKVAEVCKLDCTPTPPLPISLRAGGKHQIRVEYQHLGGTNEVPVWGGKLRLQWALPGTLRDTIPQERLFAATAAAAPGLGVGINAAYFSDATFKVEYLDFVAPSLAFTASALPGPVRAATMVCQTPGCGAGGTPGAPALVSARNVADNGDGTVSIEVIGRGAADGATVEIWRGATVTGAWVASGPGPLASFGVPAGAAAVHGGPYEGGTFTVPAALAKGAHQLAARQTVAGLPSAWSAPLSIDAAHPGAPPPPTIAVPPGGLVSGNGTVAIGGQAASGATVTVRSGTTTVGTFNADANGKWGGTINLAGVGGHDVSVTQTVGGVESATGATVTARVALPALTLDAPSEGATVQSTLLVAGSGADPDLGGVKVADGDGRYFTEVTTPATPWPSRRPARSRAAPSRSITAATRSRCTSRRAGSTATASSTPCSCRRRGWRSRWSRPSPERRSTPRSPWRVGASSAPACPAR